MYLRRLQTPQTKHRRATPQITLHDDFSGPAQPLIGRLSPVGGKAWKNQVDGVFSTDGNGNAYLSSAVGGDMSIRIDAGVAKGIRVETRHNVHSNKSIGILLNAKDTDSFVLVIPNENNAISLWSRDTGVWTNVANANYILDPTQPYAAEISPDGDTILIKDHLNVTRLTYYTPNRPLRDLTEVGLHGKGTDPHSWDYITVTRL